ncbi:MULTISPECIES: helix-turn-helix domain-containing protein [Rahnella]|uniref:XRE family transcriptional regulator n=1 Tax=Rahnella laticis TaxID=2787622 RepID=A0ABS0E4X1_9GAMM|nr:MULTISPECIES: XRE family transcriptional regulator [Rahnella]MBF7979774.1 XRE family transcriptional regulator [Rahnella laticis]MBF7999864.1 XRE family transcriptional regulator [Rahnella sp. LAC-M12]
MKDYIDVASRHITPAGGNVFADLGFSDDEAQALHAESQQKIAQTIALKEQLMAEIASWIALQNLRQSDAAKVLQVSRPRVSDVVNKKTDKFTLDTLVMMLSLTGKQVKLVVE